jgi:surface protein
MRITNDTTILNFILEEFSDEYFPVSTTDVIFTPSGGTFYAALSVILTSTTPNATIYYTIDGTVPTFSNTLYTTPINVTETTNIKAIAYRDFWEPSEVGSEQYDLTVVTPTILPASGTYTETQSVTITTTTSGASLYYTTDGSTPTSGSGTLYSGAFDITDDATVKAIGYRSGWTASSVATNVYVITGQVEAPVFDPVGDTIYETTAVTITCATPGASIYITTNGSTPTSASTLYSTAVDVTTTTTLKAIGLLTDWADSDVTSDDYEFKVYTPIASPSGSTYFAPQFVTLTCATDGADIYYTTNGSTPTSGSTLYTTPVVMSTSGTLKAIGYLSGATPSEVSSDIYTISGDIAAPVFDPVEDYYTSTQNITITVATPSGVSIYYTTDGSTPDETDTLYTTPVSISETTTLKARAYKLYWNTSDVTSGLYTITGQVDTPIISPSAGDYYDAQNVTMSVTAPTGASIYYTTDGSTPTSADTLYTTSFPVSATTTVKAIGIKQYWDDSEVASSIFNIIQPFVFTYGSNNSIQLPLVETGTYDFTVDYGDGSGIKTVTSWNDADASHTYSTSDTYTITIEGTILGWSINNGSQKQYYRNIISWGPLQLGEEGSAFYGAQLDAAITATDTLDTSQATNLENMFKDCANLVTVPNINSWDVSNVTNFCCFTSGTKFNNDLSSWNTGSATDMSEMFTGTNNAFNSDIDGWDVSNVTTFYRMFYNQSSFNQDLNSWDTGSAENMQGMFYESSFNGNIGSWNTINVTNMQNMFNGCATFNQDIQYWNVSNVTNMNRMFSGASIFDSMICRWDVSSVTDMTEMFANANAFDIELGCWETTSLTDMTGMFRGMDSFSPSGLSDWNVTAVDDFTSVFEDTTLFNGDISGWDVPSATNTDSMFKDALSFNSDISNWDTSSVESMNEMFYNAEAYNQNMDTTVYSWNPDDKSSTITLSSRDLVATQTHETNPGANYGLVREIHGRSSGKYYWEVTPTGNSAYSDAWYMGVADSTHPTNERLGQQATGWGFNRAGNVLNNNSETGTTLPTYTEGEVIQIAVDLNVGKIWFGIAGSWYGGDPVAGTGETASGLSGTLYPATSFLAWGAGNWATTTANFGLSTFSYEAPSGFSTWGDYSWDVSNVTDMTDMFRDTLAFNPSAGLNNWDVSNVTSMVRMFQGATAFNADISDWQLDSVTDMNNMFNGSVFNNLIGDWRFPQLTSLLGIFAYSTAYNQTDIDNWDTSGITAMSQTFLSSVFNQSLSSWDVSNVTEFGQCFRHADFNNNSLNSWVVSGALDMNRMFSGNACNFNGDIGDWDVSNVTNMNSMFEDNSDFQGDINSWSPSSVTTVTSMFENTPFNQPIGGWDTSSLTNISYMFQDNDAFNQDLSNWDVSNITNATHFLNRGDGLTFNKYDPILISWSAQSVNSGPLLNMGGSNYSSAGTAARAVLVGKGWSITDGGVVSPSTLGDPQFSPSGGDSAEAVEVTITTTPTSTIYYTDDLSEPTQSSTLYTGSVSVSADATIRARGYLDGYYESAITSAGYTITPLEYTTWNPSDKDAAITLSNGDLTDEISGGWRSVRAQYPKSSGKYYWETTFNYNVDGLNTTGIGAANSSAALTSYVGAGANGWEWHPQSANKTHNSVGTTWTISTPTDGDIVMVALDIDNGKIWVGVNGTWPYSGNPATGANEMYQDNDMMTDMMPSHSWYEGGTCTTNFGATAFTYTKPSGFSGWTN